jgi:hypothetical protein
MAISMKMTFLLLLCLFLTAGALGQVAAGTAPMASTYNAPDHAMHAFPQSVAQGQSLFPSSGMVTIASGELPLWEVAPEHHDMPLGEAARLQKKEHATDKKASVVWEN